MRFHIECYKYNIVTVSFYILQLEEPILLLGRERFEGVDIRIRVNGGGRVSQIYGKLAFRQIKSF